VAGTKAFRKLILQLHLWIGIAAALFLFLAGASGTLLVFQNDLDRALNPRLSRVTASPTTLSLTELKSALERQYPGGVVSSFTLSDAPEIAYVASVQLPASDGVDLAVDQYTGQVLGVWDDNRFVRRVLDFHTGLLAGTAGSAFVAWCSVILLFLAASGLFLWWRNKIFGIDFRTSGPKFQFDLHSTIGVISFAFLLAFALTGIIVHWDSTARAWAAAMSHLPPVVTDPKSDSPAADAKPMEAAQLLVLAQAAMPGAHASRIDFANSPIAAVLVTMKFPEDHTPAGRTRIYLDAYSGKVLSLTSSRAIPAAISYVTRLNREIHTGDIGGWPTRMVAAVSSLSLPVLAISGPLLWWQRRQRR
jgi:uncharacterized iron-regulated membrane protein